MINVKTNRMSYDKGEYKKKENAVKQWWVWNEREFHKTMMNMKRKRIRSNNDKNGKKENVIKQI